MPFDGRIKEITGHIFAKLGWMVYLIYNVFALSMLKNKSEPKYWMLEKVKVFGTG